MFTLYIAMILDKHFIWSPDKLRVRWKQRQSKERDRRKQESITDVYVKILQ